VNSRSVFVSADVAQRLFPADTEGMSNRAIIAVVAWSFLTAALYWGWLHWSGAVTTERRVIDGLDVYVTTAHETDSAKALIAPVLCGRWESRRSCSSTSAGAHGAAESSRQNDFAQMIPHRALCRPSLFRNRPVG
jgi:hypothetical protein